MIPLMMARNLTGFNTIIDDLDPALWYRFNEASGALINYGSLGSGLNATVANATYNQAGPNSTIPKALLLNGTTSLITIPTSAGLNSADWSTAILVNETGKGESSLGTYFEFDTTAGAGEITAAIRHSNSTTQFVASVRNAADTATNWVTDADVSFNIWSWVFMRYNNTSKRATVYKSLNRQLVTFAVTDTALTGTARQVGGGFIGNDSASARTLAGNVAQFLHFPTLLSLLQMQQIITRSGV